MTLFGHDSSSKEEKYAKAWADLYDGSATAEDRCHAKVWLIYRAIDREIEPRDLISKVLAIDVPVESQRWVASLAAAQIYYRIIIERNTPKALIEHVLGLEPNDLSTTNVLRVHAIASYAAWLSGDEAFVHGCFNEALLKWKRSVSSYSAFNNMSRLLEFQNDPPVLLFMRLLVERTFNNEFITDPVIVGAMERSQNGLTWFKAIKTMGVHRLSLW